VALARGGGTRLLTPPALPCAGTVLCCGVEAGRQVTTRHDVFHRRTLVGRLWPTEEHPPPRRMPLRRFGAGLFGVNGAEHRQRRRLMMPAFNRKRVESYRDEMVHVADDELSRWRVGETIDVSTAMSDIAKRIATKTLFGEDVGPGGGGTGQMIQQSLRLMTHPLTRLLPYDVAGMPYRRFLNLVHAIEKQIRGIVERRRAAGAEGHDVLSALIAARDDETGAALDEDELLGHVGLLFAAGHETSANALTWTLLLLSQHRDVQADLQDEIDAVFGDAPPTVENLRRAVLLERVIRESLRLLPPAIWNARVTVAPTELGGHELPAGTEILLSIFETHHAPDLYSEPDCFKPNRWADIDPGPHAYCPFGAGPRMCIGAAFAMFELPLVLAMILQRFRLTLKPNQRIDRSGHIVMGPRRGVRMCVRPRDRRFGAGDAPVVGDVRELVSLP